MKYLVLALHLANYGVIVNQQRFETGKTRPFNPTGNRQTVVHKGGITGYEQVCKHLTRWRKSDPNAVLTTMIDLYGLPTDFPKSTSSDALEKVKFLEQYIDKDYGQNKAKRSFEKQIKSYDDFKILFPKQEPKQNTKYHSLANLIAGWKTKHKRSKLPPWKVEILKHRKILVDKPKQKILQLSFDHQSN